MLASRLLTLWTVQTIGACAAGGPYQVRAAAPVDQTEAFLCVLAAVNQLGYQVQRSDRITGVVEARGNRHSPRSQGGSPYYDELRVVISHEPAGDFLLVTADDRRHAEEVLRRCGRPPQQPGRPSRSFSYRTEHDSVRHPSPSSGERL